MYGNNVQWGSDSTLDSSTSYGPNSGLLALGRSYADRVDNSEPNHASVSFDNLMIWDRVLTQEERAQLVV